MATCDLVVRGVSLLLTMDPQRNGALGAIRDAAIGIRDGQIVFVGPDRDAPEGRRCVDAQGLIAMPGLVDAHTHLVWAGSRAEEFERRLAGETYSSILESGGGILSTVRATRAAADAELRDVAVERLRFAQQRGVTTIEVKSGYGLDPIHEARLLRVAREAGVIARVSVRTTFLGAHAIPEAYRGRRAEYVQQVIEEQLPLAAPYADFIDAYVDRGAFTVEEGERVLSAGLRWGLGVRVHAEQVEYTGAAAMAASLGALSADHLERLDEGGAAAMARAGTVGVLLPGAMLYLRDDAPPVERLRAAGVRLAVATDWNPGSSPLGDLWIAATLACVTMRLTVDEALLGITRNGALALGDQNRGVVKVGAPADLALFSVGRGETLTPASLLQGLGGRLANLVVSGGRVVVDRDQRAGTVEDGMD